MSKEGINDLVLNNILKLSEDATKKVNEILKGKRPFQSKELDPDMFVWAVDNLGYQDMAELRQEFNDDAIGKMIYEANTIKQRRSNG